MTYFNMRWYEILLLLLLTPAATYLVGQTYRATHGRATMGEDLSNLWRSFTRWRRNRAELRRLRNKYKHLNKRK